MSRSDQRSYSDAERAEAVERMREHGAAEAARRTGIPGGTLRRWKMERGESGPPGGQDADDWAKRKEAFAVESFAAARSALKQVKKLVAAGKMAEAQKAAITMAILVDKSAVLEVGAATARTRVVDGEPADVVIDIPDDAARIAEVTAILREIGVVGDDDPDGRDDRWRDEPGLAPAVMDPEPVGDFEPKAGLRRVERVNGDRVDPEGEHAEIVADAETVPAVEAEPSSWAPRVEPQPRDG